MINSLCYMMNLKQHVMAEWTILAQSPSSVPDLLYDLVSKLFSLLWLQKDHVVCCLTVDTRLIFEEN